jgi:hypothetical protein
MKKVIALVAFVATFGVLAIAQTAIDPLSNDIVLREQTIEQINNLVAANATSVAANAARIADTAVIVNTNANIVLTTIVPTGTELTVLYAPNGTNITMAVNVTSSTNSWVTVKTP